jgi:anti-sigma regulatory factor (Ser/Thr protein kinase)
VHASQQIYRNAILMSRLWNEVLQIDGTRCLTLTMRGSPLTATPTSQSGTGSWPLQTNLELAALPTAVSCTRLHVRSIAREWGLADQADVAELVASELATNAIQASERLKIRADLAAVPVIRISLVSDQTSLVIRVWDACPDMPVHRKASLDQDGGRGLMLVDTLSKEWGTYQKANGKVVWAMVTSADP